MDVPYIDYKELKEFYTVDELAQLIGLDKATLKEKCSQYRIKPRRNEIGDWGFVKYDVRKLHNALYYESRGNKNDGSYQREDSPWA